MRTMRRATWIAILAVILMVGFGTAASASEPLATLSTTRLTFNDQIQGTEGPPSAVVLSNGGDGELTITSITITGQNNTEFKDASNCPLSPATLAAGATCQIQISFRPKTIGTITGTLSIADNASGSPQTVALTGKGNAAAPVVVLAPDKIAFDNQASGTSSGVFIAVLTNAGSAPLNINSPIRINGPSPDEFHLQRITNGCPYDSGQVPPNTKCGIGIVFAPTTTGAKAAQVIIEDDATGSPHAISLSGTGVGPHDGPPTGVLNVRPDKTQTAENKP